MRGSTFHPCNSGTASRNFIRITSCSGNGIRWATRPVTDVTDFALAHEVGDGADRLLEGHVGIGAPGLVEVDLVDAKALERIGRERLHRGRTWRRHGGRWRP